jgi:hypothetical protein
MMWTTSSLLSALSSLFADDDPRGEESVLCPFVLGFYVCVVGCQWHARLEPCLFTELFRCLRTYGGPAQSVEAAVVQRSHQ